MVASSQPPSGLVPARVRDGPLVVAAEDRVVPAGNLARVGDGRGIPLSPTSRGSASGSRRTIEQSLLVIARALGGDDATVMNFPWHQLRYQHTAALRAACWDRYAPATTNKLLAAVRGVLHEAWRMRLIDADDYRRAADVRGVRGTTLLRGRALSAGELRTLFTDCSTDASPVGVRDAALLGVLYGSGLRRAEIVALDVTDYDPATAALRVAHGKGRKARLTYIRGGAAAALEQWMAVLASAGDNSRDGPLFVRLRKGDTITTDRLTPSGVLLVLQRRARAAGVAPFSPHDVRRTFIGDLLDAGADISTVQRLAGHANVQTTARYDRRGERTKHTAAGLLHVPYAGRPGNTTGH